MQSISIRLPCVMHGGGVIRLAVADVHIKINAPLAMRNFHSSRTGPKRHRTRRYLWKSALPKPAGTEFALLMRKLRQTKYTKVFYDVWTDARWIETRRACAYVRAERTRMGAPGARSPIIQLTLSYTILLMRFYLIKLMPLMIPQWPRLRLH